MGKGSKAADATACYFLIFANLAFLLLLLPKVRFFAAAYVPGAELPDAQLGVELAVPCGRVYEHIVFRWP
mgnify:CR=1 FL=1